MRNKRTVGVATALMTVALMSAVVPAAQATHGTGPQCASGASCMWQDSDWHTNTDVSKKVSFQLYIPNLGTHNYAGTSLVAANSVTSVTNNGNFERAYYYNNTGCGNFAFSLGIGEGDALINDGRAAHNNNFESTAFNSYIGSC